MKLFAVTFLLSLDRRIFQQHKAPGVLNLKEYLPELFEIEYYPPCRALMRKKSFKVCSHFIYLSLIALSLYKVPLNSVNLFTHT